MKLISFHRSIGHLVRVPVADDRKMCCLVLPVGWGESKVALETDAKAPAVGDCSPCYGEFYCIAVYAIHCNECDSAIYSDANNGNQHGRLLL